MFDPNDPAFRSRVATSGLFGPGVNPQQVMRNVMRQFGIGYSPSNPTAQYLMRQAAPLMQAWLMQQAQAPSLSEEVTQNPGQSVLNFISQGLQQGPSAITGALQSIPGLLESFRNGPVPAEGDASVLANPYRDTLREQLSDPENVIDLYTMFQTPFMSAKHAQAAERGRQMAMSDIYGQAAGKGQDILDYLFGPVRAKAPFDLSGAGGGGLAPVPEPTPEGGLRPPRIAGELPPGTPKSSAQFPTPGQLPPSAGISPDILEESMLTPDEIRLRAEEMKKRKQQSGTTMRG